MVAPLFGWSAGDIVSGATALYKIGQAFSDTKGAEKQYAEASRDLEILAKDRQCARDLLNTHPNSIYTPDIEAKLMIVEIAYEVFEKHQNDYKDLESTLTATTSKRRAVLKRQGKKVKWAIEQMNGKLQTLKDAVSEPLGSINASILHMALDDLATIREASLDQKMKLLSFEKSSIQAAEHQRRDLVATQASLASVLAKLENQEKELRPNLRELEATLERIREQIKTLSVVQKLASTDPNLAMDEIEKMNKLQQSISEDTARLWDETNKLRAGQNTMSQLLSSFIDKLAKVETIVAALQLKGQRSETTTLLGAGLTLALLATNLFNLLMVRRIDDAMRQVGVTPGSNERHGCPSDARGSVGHSIEAVGPRWSTGSKVVALCLPQMSSEDTEDKKHPDPMPLVWAKATACTAAQASERSALASAIYLDSLSSSAWKSVIKSENIEQVVEGSVQNLLVSRQMNANASLSRALGPELSPGPWQPDETCAYLGPASATRDDVKRQCDSSLEVPQFIHHEKSYKYTNFVEKGACLPTNQDSARLQQNDSLRTQSNTAVAAIAPHTLFYIAWKPLAPLPQHTERPSYRRTSLRSPPVIKEAFRPQLSQPVIYKWTPGSLDPISPRELPYLEEYKTCSVFWRPDHQTYLTVPYDCTQYSVRDKARDDPLDHWERLKFNYEAIDGRCVSVVGHCNGNDLLAATGPQNWLGELIPLVHQRYKGEPAVPNTEGTSYLAGDISIIIALAALSNAANLVKSTIERSFRPPNYTTWVPHRQISQAVQAERGIVVHILTDKRFPRARTHLDAWTLGRKHVVLC